MASQDTKTGTISRIRHGLTDVVANHISVKLSMIVEYLIAI